jgi:hypothetical protein
VILITCFGVVGLMVARSAPKVREITWRGASGAGASPADNSVADLSRVIEELLDSNLGSRPVPPELPSTQVTSYCPVRSAVRSNF